MSSKIDLPRPDDWHVHFREGELLDLTLAASGRCFGRCVAMPNLEQPLTTAAAIQKYGEELQKHIPAGSKLQPLLTMYLTDGHDPQELDAAVKIKDFFAVKLYPRGATTNSTHGVSDIAKCTKFFAQMEKLGVPLLIHCESAAKEVDAFDREKVFIDESLIPLRQQFPELKITMEHISCKEAADYISESGTNTAASITPQHLAYNRNDLLGGHLQPHLFCKPILKREDDRLALTHLIRNGHPRVFLGSDSAPHRRKDKENSCGCAGVFSAPYLLEIITQIFDELGELDKLENFVAKNGAAYYGFAPAEDKLTLVKEEQAVEEYLELANGEQLVPLGAGTKLKWKLATN